MPNYSHSIIAGGLEERLQVTRLMSRTSLMMRLEILASNSCDRGSGCPGEVMTMTIRTFAATWAQATLD